MFLIDDRLDAHLGFICHANKDHWLARIKQQMKEISHLHQKKILLFTIGQIDVEKNMIEKACLIDGNREEVVETKIPHFIYNLVTHTKPASVKIIRNLRMLTDTIVINPINRFYQHIIFEMIASIIQTKDIILPYATISRSSVERFAKRYQRFFLLPQRTSKEFGVVSVSKTCGSNQESNFEINFRNMKLAVKEEDLYLEIIKIIRYKKYMLIKDPEPVIWNQSPLELRVYVQKGFTGKWSVVEIVAKKGLLSKKTFADKICDALPEVLLELFPDKLSAIRTQLHHTALDISILLDYYIPNMGCCFIDFILDDQGRPYVINIGGFEQEDYLYDFCEGKIWKEYIKNAGQYLVYLSDKD